MEEHKSEKHREYTDRACKCCIRSEPQKRRLPYLGRIFHGSCHAFRHALKDPNSQVGACIVSDDNKILSMGYNGFPKGCSDDEFPWAREGEPLDTKYLCVTHSELNADFELPWRKP